MNFPPIIRADLANHLVYGNFVAGVVAVACLLMGRPELAAAAAQGSAVVVGLAKEAHDAWVNYKATGNWRKGPHGVEGWDFLATALGGTPVAVTTMLVSP